MYTKDRVKLTLIDQLELLKKANLSYSVTKLELDSEGVIKTLSRERMVSCDWFALHELELSLKKNIDESLVKFIIGYLVKAKTLDFHDRHFEELYEEFMLLLEKGEYVFRGVCLVHGIDLVDQEYNDNEFSIKKVNREYLEYFYNHVESYNRRYAFFSPLSVLEDHYVNPTAMIEVKKMVKSAAEFKIIREKIVKIGQAILLSNGLSCNLKFSPFLKFSYLDYSGMIQGYEYINELKSSIRTSTKITNIQETISTYHKLHNIRDGFIPIDRFSSAHNKKSQQDKFLDLMIALEALFPSMKGELKFRLQISTAILLEKNIDVFNSVGKLYNKRSAIVHGSSTISYDQVKKDVSELEGIVRRVILIALEYLKEDKNLEDMEADILKKIFSTSVRQIESS